MYLKAVLVLLKKHPKAVAVQGNVWSEYGVQLLTGNNGKMSWTAGMTCGGPLTAEILRGLNPDGWEVYAEWQSPVKLS